jgi:hypothetical protein
MTLFADANKRVEGIVKALSERTERLGALFSARRVAVRSSI